MEVTSAQIYIDNADDMVEDMDVYEEEQLPDEWRYLRDLIAHRAEHRLGTVDWSYNETDVILMRECCDMQAELKNSGYQKKENSVLLECSWCDDLFLTTRHMNRHLLLHHLQWDTNCARCLNPMVNSVYRHECEDICKECGKECRSKSKMTRHMFKWHDTFYCALCEKKFNSLDDMRDHIEYENEMLEERCILCKLTFTGQDRASVFKEHLLKSHFGPMVIRKPTVFEDKTTSRSEVELITHISLAYRPNKTETYQFDNYSCPHCQRKFSAKSGLKIHVGIAHKGGKILFCPRCPASYADVEGCKVHFREEHAARKKIKKKESNETTPHKSLVPTNEPMEGQENQLIDNNLANEMSKFHFVSTTIASINLNNNNNMSQTTPQAATLSSNSNTVQPVIAIKSKINSENIGEQSVPSPTKTKARKPLPALVKIQDMNSFEQSKADNTFQKPTSKPPRKHSTQKKDSPDCKKRNSKSEQWITSSEKVNFSTLQPERTSVSPIASTPQQTMSILKPQSVAQPLNVVTSGGPRIVFTSKQIQTLANGQNPTNQPQQPLLVSQALTTTTSIINSLPFTQFPVSQPNFIPQSLIQTPSPTMSRPVKTILPNTMAPPNIGNNFQVILPNHLISQPSSQVYVPAMTASGTTILLRLEEAQQHLQNGKVTFLPSGQAAVQTQVETSVEPILGHRQSIILSPGTTSETSKNIFQKNEKNEIEVIEEVQEDVYIPNIMRDKVALNLPVVMTKRTNKKLAQDNPFFKIRMNSGDLEGICRMCESSFLFKHSEAMENHYNKEHDQQIHIHSFPLYYEINYKLNKNGSRARLKFFLCFYCGKEFTTKFNVRRHQMLYCPQKDKIDPRELGLGKMQDNLDDDVLPEVKGNRDPLGLQPVI